MRYERISELPLSFIPNERFPKVGAKAEREILGPSPPGEENRRTRPPTGLPPYLASLYETPLLSREQEQHLFRKMNYLKYKTDQLRQKIDPSHPGMARMDEIEHLYMQSVATKNEIIRANLRLVVSIAKRYATGSERLFELVSDGNISLIRAVEKFDFARGFKFSTYATWAIVKNYARTIPLEYRHQSRFHTAQEEVLSSIATGGRSAPMEELAQTHREGQIARILNRLDERERQIIRYRFGLDHERNPMTLKQVGKMMGVTKERIRQIETRAIDKLRGAAHEEGIEIPDDR